MTKLQAENCQLKWELKYLRQQHKNLLLCVDAYEFQINSLKGKIYINEDIIDDLKNKIDQLKNKNDPNN